MKKSLLLVLCFIVSIMVASAQTVTVSSNITTNTTWTKNNTYLLSVGGTGGFIYVTNNAELTIEPGTLILGDKTSLVITRGAKIHAVGTETQPIVFTSSKPAGQRARADWGGLLILGNATINDPAGSRVAEGGIDATLGLYGGTNDADNSGELSYVRIEFAGAAFVANSETNGLTMGGVGSGTQIDHIMVAYGGDDSFEWFGGTVNGKYLVSHRGLDDDFDTDYGYRGKVQFATAQRDPNVADDPAISRSNGFESDNDAGGTTNNPRTNAQFSNITVVGPFATPSTTVAAGFGRALHIRKGSQLDVYNSTFLGFATGLKVEGGTTFPGITSGDLEFKNNYFAGVPAVLDSSATSGFNVAAWFANSGNTSGAAVGDAMLTTPFNLTAPDFRLMSSSPLLSGASFTATNLTNSFFTPTTYRGAFDGTNNWTKCWCEFDAVNAVYTSPINYASPVAVTAMSSTLTATAGFTSYLWSNGATTASITVADNNTYTVTVENARGCHATASGAIVGVENVSAFKALNISPNPTQGMVNVDFTLENSEEVSINIFDLNGRMIYSNNQSLSAGNQNIKVDMTGYTNGLYSLRLQSKNGVITSKIQVLN